MRMRGVIVSWALVSAGVLGAASTAWGCFVPGTSPQVAVEPNRAPEGSQVTVRGINWATSEHGQPVTVRWASEDGAVLGVVEPTPNGQFSVAVTIPSEGTGYQQVYAVQPGKATAAATVEVTPVPTTASGSGQIPPAGGTTALAAAAPAAGGVQSVPSSVETASGGLPTAPVGTPASSASPAPAPATNGTAPARPSGAVPTQAASFTGVAAPVAVADGAPTAAGPGWVASPGSAIGDLWGGLARGTEAPIGLTDLPGATEGTGSSSAQAAVALVLGGVAAIMAGFGAAELRRRRALVRIGD